MKDITKLAFLNSIGILREYLPDIVIGGGWAPLIYYHYLLGLTATFKSMDTPPIIHYEGNIEGCDIEIEFLTDQEGSIPDVVIEVQKGLHAEALRYISIATDNTIAVTIDDFANQEMEQPFQVKG